MKHATSAIPNRSAFKASEVCEIAELQPYVLRSWEAEFPDLGVARRAGTGRVYRRADVELVLRLKQLLFVDGLTLGGARRKLEEERAVDDLDLDESLLGDPLEPRVRQSLVEVKEGLRSILQLLGSNGEESAAAEAPDRPASGSEASARLESRPQPARPRKAESAGAASSPSARADQPKRRPRKSAAKPRRKARQSR